MLTAMLTAIGAFVVWLVLYNLVLVGIPTVLGKWYARSIRRTIPRTFALIWKLSVWLFTALLKFRQSTSLPQTASHKEETLHATYAGKTGRDIVVVPSRVHQPIIIELKGSKLRSKK